ncbi:protein adenylyltransferase SelO family protein [Photobacterium nomapromontoriensis]|uniref:protein adenylyltransferase SelO family protein n=1 Tax=Photobacterium nomapromontoriensis TaxID=2910237 RepID=UPI003D13887D
MINNILITFPLPDRDNTLLYKDCLPIYSFVEYDTYKVKNAEIAWLNHAYLNDLSIDLESAEKIILDNFAYVSRSYAPDEALDLNDHKIFLADRYGNTGDAGNGGSARCGINGKLQIKGNGVNPLVAINVDEGHSSGKLPLNEALSEALWSEICHNELPYGALRIIAVIRTPQTIVGANTFGDTVEQPCSIMIRELATRPAHYEPALNFWPKQEYARLRDITHKYVEESIKMLEQNELRESGSHSPIFDLSKRFVIRFASQVAASRVKGMPHGSLTSSNIALDGRFLDLGTISGIGDFSNVLLTSGLGATWDDHYGITDWLTNLFYHFNRHSLSGLNAKQQQTLIATFLTTLEEEENKFTAIECGIPVSTKNFIDIGKQLKEILRKGKTHVSRLSECDFNRDKFLSDVKNALSQVGYPDSIPIFKYRDIKYSRFTIFSDKRLTGNCGSKNEINELFSTYLA